MTPPAPSAPSSLRDRLLDTLERAGWTAGQQIVAVFTINIGRFVGLPWAYALSTGAGAFLISILLTISQYAIGAHALPFWADTAVRVVKTFAAALVGVFGAQVLDIRHVHWIQALNTAGLAAILALGKCLLSPNAHLSGSTLPTPVVTRIHGVQLAPGGGFHKV